MATFGEILRGLRAKKGITLRSLAIKSDVDVSYLSRIERGGLPPPQKEELLGAIIEGVDATNYEAQQLRDQAALDIGAFPKDIAGQVKEMGGIPLLLRSVGNKRLSPEKIREITEYINENY